MLSRSILGKDRLLAAFGVLAWLVGIVLRVRYALFDHPPRHNVYSDAFGMLKQGIGFADETFVQNISSSIWPPGVQSLLTLLMNLDPTGELVGYVYVVLGSLVPLLIAHTAYLFGGRRTAWFALGFASLHFGFVHYSGFFLSEFFALFFVTLAAWLTSLVLVSKRDNSNRSLPYRALSCALFGVPIGAVWLTASLMRSNVVPVWLFACVCISVYWFVNKKYLRLVMVASAVLTFAILVSPAAHRCTTLKETGFCLISSNGAMNVALGQAGERKSLRFVNQETGVTAKWSPPALIQHRYEGVAEVPAGMYDSRGILKWLWQRFKNDPVTCIARALGNGLDLFQLYCWPKDVGKWSSRITVVMLQLFFIFVIVPSLLFFARVIPFLFRNKAPPEVVFFFSAMLGVFLVACITLGEQRYRVPFDIFWIVFAAMMWSRSGRELESKRGEPSESLVRIAASTAAVLCVAVSALVVAVSHPNINLGHQLPSVDEISAVKVKTMDATKLGREKSKGHTWNQDTRIIACNPDCPELRVSWAEIQKARRVELSLDGNDSYRINVYKSSELVQAERVKPAPQSGGLRLFKLEVETPREGFDEIGIIPVWGDGRYAVGHAVPRGPVR